MGNKQSVGKTGAPGASTQGAPPTTALSRSSAVTILPPLSVSPPASRDVRAASLRSQSAQALSPSPHVRTVPSPANSKAAAEVKGVVNEVAVQAKEDESEDMRERRKEKWEKTRLAELSTRKTIRKFEDSKYRELSSIAKDPEIKALFSKLLKYEIETVDNKKSLEELQTTLANLIAAKNTADLVHRTAKINRSQINDVQIGFFSPQSSINAQKAKQNVKVNVASKSLKDATDAIAVAEQKRDDMTLKMKAAEKKGLPYLGIGADSLSAIVITYDIPNLYDIRKDFEKNFVLMKIFATWLKLSVEGKIAIIVNEFHPDADVTKAKLTQQYEAVEKEMEKLEEELVVHKIEHRLEELREEIETLEEHLPKEELELEKDTMLVKTMVQNHEAFGVYKTLMDSLYKILEEVVAKETSEQSARQLENRIMPEFDSLKQALLSIQTSIQGATPQEHCLSCEEASKNEPCIKCRQNETLLKGYNYMNGALLVIQHHFKDLHKQAIKFVDTPGANGSAQLPVNGAKPPAKAATNTRRNAIMDLKRVKEAASRAAEELAKAEKAMLAAKAANTGNNQAASNAVVRTTAEVKAAEHAKEEADAAVAKQSVRQREVDLWASDFDKSWAINAMNGPTEIPINKQTVSAAFFELAREYLVFKLGVLSIMIENQRGTSEYLGVASTRPLSNETRFFDAFNTPGLSENLKVLQAKLITKKEHIDTSKSTLENKRKIEKEQEEAFDNAAKKGIAELQKLEASTHKLEKTEKMMHALAKATEIVGDNLPMLYKVVTGASIITSGTMVTAATGGLAVAGIIVVGLARVIHVAGQAKELQILLREHLEQTLLILKIFTVVELVIKKLNEKGFARILYDGSVKLTNSEGNPTSEKIIISLDEEFMKHLLEYAQVISSTGVYTDPKTRTGGTWFKDQWKWFFSSERILGQLRELFDKIKDEFQMELNKFTMVATFFRSEFEEIQAEVKESRAFSKLLEEYKEKTYSQKKKQHTGREQFKTLESDLKEISDVFPNMAGAMAGAKLLTEVAAISTWELIENGLDVAVKVIISEALAHAVDAPHGGGRGRRTRRARHTRRAKAGCRKFTRRM